MSTDKNNNAEVEIIKDEDNSKKRSALISYVTIASSASSNKLTAKNLTMSQNKSVTIKGKMFKRITRYCSIIKKLT